MDTKTGKEILQIWHRASKEQGQTVVAVTHAGYVKGYMDRLLIIRNGKLFSQVPQKESEEEAYEKLLQVLRDECARADF